MIPVKHLILEIRYEASLAFYAVMDQIGLAFSESFPDWERSPLTLEIRDKKNRRRCFLSHRRSFYEAIDFSSERTEFEKAGKIFDKLHHDIQFTRVSRFGVRQFAAVEWSGPYPELVKKTANKVSQQSEELNQMFRGRVEDIGYSFVVKTENGWKYNLRFGPMERSQWFDLIPYEVKVFPSRDEFAKYKDSLPERFLFLDIDAFQEDVPTPT